MMASLSRWFRSRSRTVQSRAAGRKNTACKLHLETLEDRIVPSTAVYFDDFARAPAVDSSGNQYVLYEKLHGTVDLDPDPARTSLVTGFDYTDFGYTNGQFVVKYSPAHEVLWVKSAADQPGIGGPGGLKIAAEGGAEYLYGFGSSLTKLNLDGTLVWSAPAPLHLFSIAIDEAGALYGAGQGYVTKWATADGAPVWSQWININATAIAVANGVVYAGGSYQGNVSAFGGTLTDDRIDSASTSPDGFLAAFDTIDGSFQSVAHFIDAKPALVRAVGPDVYLTAQFGYTADLDPGAGQRLLTPGNVNGENLAVARLAYNTSPTPTWTLNWANKFVSSGTGQNLAGGLEVSGGDLYVSGQFGATTDFDPSAGTYNLTAAGGHDIFAMKLNAATGGLAWVSQMGSTSGLAVGPVSESAGLVLTPDGIYLGGDVGHGTVNFVGPDHNVVKIMDAGLGMDAFVAKLGTDGSYQWSFGVGALGRTMDDGDPGYAESGSGWKNLNLGWDGESRTHAKGNGSNTATWTFTGLPNGTYQVVTRYPTGNTPQKNASNALFSVNGTLVTVDQRTAPNDFAVSPLAGTWEDLGTFAVTDGTLTVVLSDAANGTVIADAMRIWCVAPPVSPLLAAGSPVTANLSTQTLTAASTITSIEGTIFADANSNGTFDPGESGLNGWTVYLDINNNSIIDSGEPTTLTVTTPDPSPADGHYEFDTTNVPPAFEYPTSIIDYVRLDLQAGSELAGRWLNTTVTYARIDRLLTADATANFGVVFQPNVGVAPAGPELLVNQTIDGQQGNVTANGTNVSVSADALGNYVVAWRTVVSPGTVNGDTIYARVFDVDGLALSNEILVGTATSASNGYAPMPKVATAGNGQFTVAWESFNNTLSGARSVFARTYQANGTAITGTVTVLAATTTTSGDLLGVAKDADGDFVVLYRVVNNSKGGSPTIKAQRYTPGGAANGNAISVATLNLVNGHANVAMSSGGSFVVVWDESIGSRNGSSTSYIFGQRFNASGSKAGSLITVTSGTTSSGRPVWSSVAMNANGQFVVTYEIRGPIRQLAQVYNANGTPAGTAVQFAAGSLIDAEHIPVAMDSVGNVTFAWTSTSTSPLTGEVRMRRLPAGALEPEPEMIVNTTTQGAQYRPGVAATGDGTFVVAWQGYGPGDDAGIFFQRYAPPTSPLMASAAPATSSGAVLTEGELDPLVQEAIARWEATGLTAAQMDLLRSVSIQVADLGGTTLGLASGTTIRIDDSAADWGWFADSTPSDDSEFTAQGNQGEKNRIDLLTVIMHEMGHILGFDHDVDGVMQDALDPGTRWLPSIAAVDDYFGVLGTE